MVNSPRGRPTSPVPKQSYKIPEDELLFIDPAIRELIVDLNSLGYETFGSCEGHLTPTGVIHNGYIDFAPGAIKTVVDKREVRNIVSAHTKTKILWFSARRIVFKGSVSAKPTASGFEAIDLLQDIESGGKIFHRSPKRILALYDVDDLRERAAVAEAWLDRERTLGGQRG